MILLFTLEVTENKFFEHHKKLIKEKLKIGKRILVVGDKINIKRSKSITICK